MESRVISAGLTALARAGMADNCYQGHFGCAMLASYFLTKDFKLPAGTISSLEDCREALRTQEPTLFSPEEERGEKPTPRLIEQLRNYLHERIGDLSRSGHVSIVGMYALRGFRENPETITSRRVEGIIKLIEAYMRERPEPRYYGYPLQYGELSDEIVAEIPEYRIAKDAFGLAISETKVLYPDGEVKGVYYYFTGEKLHGLTHAHALYELERMGEMELAELAYSAHRLQIALNRAQPPRIKPIRGTSKLTPRHVRFWKRVPVLKHQLGVPHTIKRSYTLLRAWQLGLLGSLDDKLARKLSYVFLRW